MGRFDAIKDLKAKYKKEAKAKGAKLVKEELTELFNSFPKLQAIRWRQYTPYFNDGEECIFHFREIEAKADGLTKWVDSNGFTESIDEYDATLELAINKINKEFEGIEDVLKEAFGDHQEVTVSRDGDSIKVESEDYDHD